MSIGVLVLGLASGTTQVASAAPRSGAGQQSRSVTLITGDRVVTLDANKARTIIPGKGREKLGFSTYTRNGHLFVVPRDAVPLVAQRRLDERLFDVTTLLSSGYDDASRSTLPLIVSREPGMAQAAVAGATTTANLAVVNASAMAVDKNGAAWPALAGAGVRKVWLDGKRKATLDRSTAQIGAPAAWQAGHTGAGVKVAVLDTGVDQTHPDLATREVAEKNFTSSRDAVDRVGHGTHVASTIAGTGAKANGKYKGVAYGASILDGKVLDDGGSGYDSWIIAGMEWAVGQGAKIVNMSLGGGDTSEIDPMEDAVNTLSAKHGTLFVIAAGNAGPRPETIGSPGSADAALTVGAVNRDDSIADFSSRGPRVGGGAVKPEITAPGVDIAAAQAAGTRMGKPVADGYVAASGTSMATPHVAGVAALLAQVHPDWTGEQLKATLTASAKPNNKLTALDQGAGRVDVARAITQAVTTVPANADLGTQLWPHDDDKPVSKNVTYRNSGKADVTFDIAMPVLGPDGKAAPKGILTVSPAKVTVPAGGEASVTITGNTRLGVLDGYYSGKLTATASTGAVVNTAVVINREVESYTLTINHIGPDGAPAGGAGTSVAGLETPKFDRVTAAADGKAVVRLPKGGYTLDSQLDSGGRLSWLAYPMFSLTGDTTVDLDFRQTRQTRITPPDPAAKLELADISYLRTSGRNTGGYGWLLTGGDLGTVWTAHVGPTAGPHELATVVSTQWTNPKGDYFGLGFHHAGAMVTGFTKTVKQEDLAHVHATFGAAGPVLPSYRYAVPHSKSVDGPSTWTRLLPVTLPGERNEYYTTEDLSWMSGLWITSADTGANVVELTGPLKVYQHGRTYEESFNRGVFGPAMPTTNAPYDYVTRAENTISVDIPLFGDGSGNAGISVVDKAATVLYRDGKKIGETEEAGRGRFDVPAKAGNYLLTTEATRSSVSDLATTVRASWTFRSGTVGADPVRLPLSAVRYTPALDATNSAPAGKSFIVPVSVQAQNSGQGTVPKSLKVDASFDGGLTWTPTTVVANVFAVVQHPNDATSVSLRAKATDRAGNAVEQTIINAYKLH
ncbi:subtilisin family serine protease/ethanolamine utilization microcompartment shell protein EutS [Kibdelosporangium banguiense]|uniref:Subtilisin family serine protease/ethanolamine utilization microcompartment shell protein EutS n=1 Tax=Kibdelosporangium banguiense TaxID=1365924 RepID=A0ABS4TX75_9PSEU|nr:subtilisin family serine protease/ethanolamine utilization microcompartment shell protein EutS [Kibdelosporangium banguiense]